MNNIYLIYLPEVYERLLKHDREEIQQFIELCAAGREAVFAFVVGRRLNKTCNSGCKQTRVASNICRLHPQLIALFTNRWRRHTETQKPDSADNVK